MLHLPPACTAGARTISLACSSANAACLLCPLEPFLCSHVCLQNALQQAMLSYQYRREVGQDGTVLLVTALTEDWVPAVADLLTESFAAALGAAPYTNFLRRQVKAYLEQHSRLPPKAVVLVALLLPAQVAEGAGSQAVEPGAVPLAAEAGSTSSSNGNGNGFNAMSSSSIASSSSESPSSPAGLPGSLPAWAQQPQEQQAQQEAETADMADGMAIHPLFGMMGSASSSSNSECSSDDKQEQVQQQQRRHGPGSGAVLAGVVELSFSASTRSQYFTLNPPEVSEQAKLAVGRPAALVFVTVCSACAGRKAFSMPGLGAGCLGGVGVTCMQYGMGQPLLSRRCWPAEPKTCPQMHFHLYLPVHTCQPALQAAHVNLLLNPASKLRLLPLSA